jgi:hypothetical protein
MANSMWTDEKFFHDLTKLQAQTVSVSCSLMLDGHGSRKGLQSVEFCGVWGAFTWHVFLVLPHADFDHRAGVFSILYCTITNEIH